MFDSRTRQLYGEEVFLSLFCKILSMCVEKGMVSGKRQAIDSAFIKATGYCSGDALNYLEEKGIDAWMPNFGQFTPQREGFIYNKEQNQYECQRGNRAILPFKSIRADNQISVSCITRRCSKTLP